MIILTNYNKIKDSWFLKIIKYFFIIFKYEIVIRFIVEKNIKIKIKNLYIIYIYWQININTLSFLSCVCLKN